MCKIYFKALIYSLKLATIFLLCGVISIQSAELNCDFDIDIFQNRVYMCEGKITTTKGDNTVASVKGDHVSGMGNDQVNEVVIQDSSMEVLPKNLKTWFKNYDNFGISNIQNLPNFNRDTFEEFEHVIYFFAKNISSVTNIPRDTFWDMKDLVRLSLESMPNMNNLNADLLLQATRLEYFSARGPNKIDQINPGFFRNQRNYLRTVDFRQTNLIRVSYTVFRDLTILNEAYFINSGCLNRYYYDRVPEILTADIRARCQNVSNNRILKNLEVSSEDEED